MNMRALASMVLGLSLLAAASSCGNPDDSDDNGTLRSGSPYPAPGPNGEIRGLNNFALLMERFPQGRVTRTPWAGYWWPYSSGGVENALSLYGQARGSGDALRWEQANHSERVPGVQNWWGHCNGWAAAATLYREPRELKQAGGVGFSVSDQKALLSEIGMEIYGDFFGQRAESSSSEEFEDVLPNQFFLVLTNYVGQGVPLIIDRYTGYQVWNQPIAGYQIAPVTPDSDLGPAPGAPEVHRVLVTTKIWWARNDVNPNHLTEPFVFADSESFESRVLRGEIWLDAPPVFDSGGKLTRSGNVILARRGTLVRGGAWRIGDLPTENSYPDYLWVARSAAPSSGYTNPAVDIGWVASQFGH
jgi:hypothetical protein